MTVASLLRKFPRLGVWLASLVILSAAILVYWPGLSGPFVFDDYPNIVTNPKVHPEHLDAVSLERAMQGYEPGDIGRPLATLSFALNYYCSGDKPWSYKLTGVAVHAVNAALVFWLLLTIVRLPNLSSKYGAPFCFAIALLWAVHPLQVSTVLYVVQRMESLSLSFVLAGLISYVHARRIQIETDNGGWGWLIGSAIVASIGLLSKETAALYPLYTLVLELTVLGFAARKSGVVRFYKWSYLTAAIVGAIVFLVWVLPPAVADGAFTNRSFNAYERVLSQFRILPMYLGQVLLPLPSHLLFYYDNYPKSTGWLSPLTTLVGALFILVVLVAAWIARKRMPLVALGIFWFFSAHLITSNVLNLELAFEHRNYFAILGVLLVMGDLVSRIRLRDGPGLKCLAVAAIVLAVGGLAAIRSATWGNELLLFNDMVDNNRQSPRAGSDLAALLVSMANGERSSPLYSAGKQQFERVARLPGSSPLPEQGLIMMAAVHGEPVDNMWWDSLIEKVRTRPLSPEELLAVTGLLKQRYEGMALDDARLKDAYLALLARGPKQAFLYAQFGDYALQYLHDEELADRMFVAAIEHSAKDRQYANEVLAGLLSDGRMRQAKLVAGRGVELGLFDAKQSMDALSLGQGAATKGHFQADGK